MTQRMLIERCAWLQVHVMQMDRKAGAGGLTDLDHRVFLAWNNSLVRALAALGLEGVPARVQTLAERMALSAAARPAA